MRPPPRLRPIHRAAQVEPQPGRRQQPRATQDSQCGATARAHGAAAEDEQG